MKAHSKRNSRLGWLSAAAVWTFASLIPGTGLAPGAERTSASAPDAIEKQFGLKAGPGRELVLAHCLPCHSTAIVAANHLSRERWSELLMQMQEKNGMRPIDNSVREKILNYLEQAQRPEDAGLNAGKQTPWAAPLYRPNPIW
jgi:hypothetical protein